jgi:hypothetical protein
VNLCNWREVLAVSIILTATFILPACTTDTESSTTTTTAVAETTPGDSLALPTVEDLREMLKRGFDSRVPISEKVDLVQGSEADPDLANRVATAATQAGLTVEIVNVNGLGPDAAQAVANFIVDGQSNPGVVPLVAEDGKWKLEKSWACYILTIVQTRSPACP